MPRKSSIGYIIAPHDNPLRNRGSQLYALPCCGAHPHHVVALLLSIIPHVVEPVDSWHCLVSGPTLMLSTLIMVLYVVDQVQHEAELYYVCLELIITFIALLNLFLVGDMMGAIYGLFYTDLMIAFGMDIYYMKQERGLTF